MEIKKISALLLGFLMLFSVLPVSFAEETEEPTEYAMSVQLPFSYHNFETLKEGWEYALSLDDGYKKTVILHKDWIAGDTNENGIIDDGETPGNFEYDHGTDKGRLCVYGGYYYQTITINLNGHKIDRGLTQETESGQVIKVMGGSVLGIIDTSEEKTGIITGGYNNGIGGAIYLEGGSSLNMRGGTICGNRAANGGAVGMNKYCSFNMYGGVIEDNHATENGGAVYVNSEADSGADRFLFDGGIVRNNTAGGSGGGFYISSAPAGTYVLLEHGYIHNNTAEDFGGGVYVSLNSNVTAYFYDDVSIKYNSADNGGGVYALGGNYDYVNAHIEENRAYTKNGGVGTKEHMNTTDGVAYGKIRFGGSVRINNNYVQAKDAASPTKYTNYLIGDNEHDIYYYKDCAFTSDACVGITMYQDFTGEGDKISDGSANFKIRGHTHFKSDDDGYVISAKYNPDSTYDKYQIYYKEATAVTNANIKEVTVNESLIGDSPVIIPENRAITIYVKPETHDFLRLCALEDIASFTFYTDGTYISDLDNIRDFVGNGSDMWQVMAPDGTYEMWHIAILPVGSWVDSPGRVATVYWEGTTKYYSDFELAWTDAVTLAKASDSLTFDVKLTLYKDFLAGDSNSNGVIDEGETPGNFQFFKDGKEFGTNKGRLLFGGSYQHFAIDLNGYKIDRGLTENKESGQVFKFEDECFIKFEDSSKEKTGMICGGKNNVDDGSGGALYITDNAMVYFCGGTICGNEAEYGGAASVDNGGRFRMEGGTIKENTAKYGGAIAARDTFFTSSSTVHILGGSIENNTATEKGGAIYMGNRSKTPDNHLCLEGGTIKENTAKYGGGVYAEMDSSARFEVGLTTTADVYICDNTAEYGGGFYIGADARATFVNATIKNNRAYTAGGGVYCDEDSYDPIFGGDTYIFENYVQAKESADTDKSKNNLMLEKTSNCINNYTALTLRDGAKIGISIGYDTSDKCVLGSGAKFEAHTHQYFVADDDAYILRNIIGGTSDNPVYFLNITKKPVIDKISAQRTAGVDVTVDAYIIGTIVNAKVIFAGYKDNRLVDTAINSFRSSKETAKLYGDIDTVKVMIWKDMESAVPYCNAIDTTFSD